MRLQVHGDGGSAVIHDDQLEFFAADGDARYRASELVAAGELRGGDRGADAFVVGHLRQYEDIVDAIDGGRYPGVRVEDAYVSLCVVRAVYLSATLGRPVRIDEVLSGELDDVVVSTGPVTSGAHA